jgi:predicted GIY-YIG superfamily endonuclease
MRFLPLTFHGLPSVAFSERDKLPDTWGVYFVMAERRLLYIGSAQNIRARWVNHHHIKKAAAEGATKIAWLQVRRIELWEVEKFAIVENKPLLNRQVMSHTWRKRDKDAIQKSILRHQYPDKKMRWLKYQELQRADLRQLMPDSHPCKRDYSLLAVAFPNLFKDSYLEGRR